jgi:NADPH:quinone reductase-like Zn-dependent oxidoreductase
MAVQYGKVAISRFGGPEVLEIVREDLRDAAAGEVRVKVLAAGVSWVDYMLRHGAYPRQPKPPLVPGYDVVGVVDQLGPGVTRFATGQMVAALTVTGGYSEVVFLPEGELVPVPAGLDPAAAVCLVLNYVTAYQMLRRVAGVARGARMLAHSAAGGVGTALLELGRLAGLETFGTASAGKRELVTGLGARFIDYQSQDFVARVHQLAPGGIEVAFDAIGGSHWLRSRRCLRRGGQLIAYGSQAAMTRGRGFLARSLPDLTAAALLTVFPRGRRFRFYSITATRARHPEWFEEDLSTLFHLLAEGQIQPVIAQRLPWTEARRANELLEQGAVQGRLVLVF